MQNTNSATCFKLLKLLLNWIWSYLQKVVHYLSVCDLFSFIYVCMYFCVVFFCVYYFVLFLLYFFYLSCLYALLFFNAIHYEFHYYLFKLLTI